MSGTTDPGALLDRLVTSLETLSAAQVKTQEAITSNSDLLQQFITQGPPNITVTAPISVSEAGTTVTQPDGNGLSFATPGSRHKDAVAKPKSFDGSAKHLPRFLRSLFLYFGTDDKFYGTPMNRVRLALSHMNEGTAEGWAGKRIDLIEANKLTYQTWDAFRDEIKMHFSSPNLKLESQVAIRDLKQGSMTATEFFIEFETHAAFAEFDDNALTFFLVSNLNHSLLQSIARCDPPPAKYGEWKAAALRLDASWRAVSVPGARTHTSNQTRGHTPAPKAPTQSFPPTFRYNYPAPAPSFAPAAVAPAATTASSSSTAARDPDAMEIDARRGGGRGIVAGQDTRTCFKCGRVGHIAAQCPTAHKNAFIRHMYDSIPEEDAKAHFASDLLLHAVEGDFMSDTE